MAGSRLRTRRRIPVDAAVVCAGHQELRDIVVETQTDVKHILKSLDKGSKTMEELDTRVDVLETAESTRQKAEETQQKTKNERRSIFDSRTTVISLIIAAASVGVAIMAIFW